MDVCPKIIWHFLARFVIRILMTMIMLFNVIFVFFGSTLNNINYIDYKHLQGNNDPCYCITCLSSIFPFNCSNNRKFGSLLISQTETNKYSFDSNNSSLLLNPSPKLTNLVNQFNNNTIIDNIKNVDDNFIPSKCFHIDEIQKLEITNKEKCLSLFHINVCSLSKNFDELQHLLKSTNKNFDCSYLSKNQERYFYN